MTSARYLEIFVEERSMEAFLRELLPRLAPDRQFDIRVVGGGGKERHMKDLRSRLVACGKSMFDGYRLIVMVDCDDEDCFDLKARMESMARSSGLVSRSRATGGRWQVVNRIVKEELEAWYFGDWSAVRQAYPRVPENIPRRRRYRRPDEIAGGTWEAFQHILQESGYYPNRLPKIEAARMIARYVDPNRNRSPSFQAFRDAVREAVA